jgi:hypothetical protein
MATKKRQALPLRDYLYLLPLLQLDAVKDQARLKKVARTLRDASKGRKVSRARLETAQEFCLEFLEGLNSLRPESSLPCSGGRD